MPYNAVSPPSTASSCPTTNDEAGEVASLAGALYASHEYLLERRGEPLDAATHSWVDWDRRLACKPVFGWLQQRFPQRRIVARGLSTADVLQAVLAGAGIGPLPCIVGDVEAALVRLVDAPKEAWSPVWLLTHGELKEAGRIRAVVAHLSEALRRARPTVEGAPEGA